MKDIKNIFKKNQVIIAALAIMIIVAGYLNFTRGKIGDQSKKDIETNANIPNEQLDITDASQVGDDGKVVVNDEKNKAADSKDVKKEETKKDDAKKAEENKNADSKKTAGAASSEAGEAVLANQGVDSDFFVANKMKREQTRSKNEETLNGIINNAKATDKQKQDAIDQMIALTDIKEKESVTETLLEAKGFTETLVTINDGKVEVVVNANNLTEQDIAQIEDVVKRKSGIASKNIVITPVKVGATATKDSANKENANKDSANKDNASKDTTSKDSSSKDSKDSKASQDQKSE